MAIVHGTVGPMQPSNYFLDTFVAHKYSLLTECGAPELLGENRWLNTFILTSAFQTTLPAKTRAYIFNFIRRAEGAFFTYREARMALLEHISTPANIVSPYFRALLSFEICLAQCYQVAELLMSASGIKLFEQGDQNDVERLQKLCAVSKHMNMMITGGVIPTEGTVAVWITNQGLESDRSELTFNELADLLTSMKSLAEKLSRLDPGRR